MCTFISVDLPWFRSFIACMVFLFKFSVVNSQVEQPCLDTKISSSNNYDSLGRKQGLWVDTSWNLFYDIPQFCYSYYENDMLNGKQRCFDLECRWISESNYLKGVVDGMSIVYRANKTKINERFFCRGELKYEKEYYPTGIVAKEMYYKSGHLIMVVYIHERGEVKKVHLIDMNLIYEF